MYIHIFSLVVLFPFPTGVRRHLDALAEAAAALRKESAGLLAVEEAVAASLAEANAQIADALPKPKGASAGKTGRREARVNPRETAAREAKGAEAAETLPGLEAAARAAAGKRLDAEVTLDGMALRAEKMGVDREGRVYRQLGGALSASVLLELPQAPAGGAAAAAVLGGATGYADAAAGGAVGADAVLNAAGCVDAAGATTGAVGADVVLSGGIGCAGAAGTLTGGAAAAVVLGGAAGGSAAGVDTRWVELRGREALMQLIESLHPAGITEGPLRLSLQHTLGPTLESLANGADGGGSSSANTAGGDRAGVVEGSIRAPRAASLVSLPAPYACFTGGEAAAAAATVYIYIYLSIYIYIL